MKEQIRHLLEAAFYSNQEMSEEISQLKIKVQTGQKSSLSAARELVSTYLNTFAK
jgi:hypothetical protein